MLIRVEQPFAGSFKRGQAEQFHIVSLAPPQIDGIAQIGYNSLFGIRELS